MEIVKRRIRRVRIIYFTNEIPPFFFVIILHLIMCICNNKHLFYEIVTVINIYVPAFRLG